MQTGQIRYDLFADRHVIIAPQRMRRPDFPEAWPTLPNSAECPFCEGREHLTPPEIFALRDNSPPNTPGWRTRVVPNRFLALAVETPCRPIEAPATGEGYEGFGAHEILIDSPEHRFDPRLLRTRDARAWLWSLRERLRDLRHDSRLRYFALFKNHGRAAGASQPHPHTQIVAMPLVPAPALARLQRAHAWYKAHGQNPFDAAVREAGEGGRLIAESDRFALIAPYAPRFAYETVLVAKHGVPVALWEMDDPLLDEAAALYTALMRAAGAGMGDFPFNLTFNTPPAQPFGDEALWHELSYYWRFALTLSPRLYGAGGLEAAEGIPLNPVPPEAAARRLAETIKEYL